MEPSDSTPLPAGDLGRWLEETRAVLRGDGDADVPCGSCTACCESSQFVHVGPDEHDALAHLPAALLFPAPGAPRGWQVLPYDERGRCPMLGDEGCTIYEHRPRTCRTYDCRVFAATGVAPPLTQVAVRARVDRWRFDGVGDLGRRLAARAAHLAAHPEDLPPGASAAQPAHVAIAAIESSNPDPDPHPHPHPEL